MILFVASVLGIFWGKAKRQKPRDKGPGRANEEETSSANARESEVNAHGLPVEQ